MFYSVPDKPRGVQLQETAGHVLRTRAEYNQTLVPHGPSSLEASEAKQRMLFAQMLAQELISE